MGTVQTGDFGAPTLFSQCQIPEIWLEKGFESIIGIIYYGFKNVITIGKKSDVKYDWFMN